MLNKKEYNREYQLKNREVIYAKHREWLDKNKEKQKQYHKEYHKKWYQEHKEARQKQIKEYSLNHREDNVKRVQRYVKRNLGKVKKYREHFERSNEGKYRQLMWRAKHFAGTPLTLDEYVEIIKRPCVYCGQIGKIGIDRINNSFGYTKENSAPCCKLCNFMKKALNVNDFLSHIKKIYLHNK